MLKHIHLWQCKKIVLERHFVLCVIFFPLSQHFLLCLAPGTDLNRCSVSLKERLLANTSWIGKIQVVEWCAVPQTWFEDGVPLGEMGMKHATWGRPVRNEKPGVGAEMQLFLGCVGVTFLYLFSVPPAPPCALSAEAEEVKITELAI